MRQCPHPSEKQCGGKFGGSHRIGVVAPQHALGYFEGDADERRHQIVCIDGWKQPLGDGAFQIFAQFLKAGNDLLRVHANSEHVGVAADGAEIRLVAGDIFEKGAEATRNEFFNRARFGTLLMQARADAQRAFVLDRLEHFFLRSEVIVERARGERCGPDDVAHGGGAIAELSKDLSRRLQNRMPVLSLCQFPLSARLRRQPRCDFRLVRFQQRVPRLMRSNSTEP